MDDDDDGDKIRLKLRPCPPENNACLLFFSLKNVFFFFKLNKAKGIHLYDSEIWLTNPFCLSLFSALWRVVSLSPSFFLPYLSIVFSSWNCYFCYSYKSTIKWDRFSYIIQKTIWNNTPSRSHVNSSPHNKTSLLRENYVRHFCYFSFEFGFPFPNSWEDGLYVRKQYSFPTSWSLEMREPYILCLENGLRSPKKL